MAHMEGRTTMPTPEGEVSSRSTGHGKETTSERDHRTSSYNEQERTRKGSRRMGHEAEESERRSRYEREHGFAPTSIAAYILAHPERCSEYRTRTGRVMVSYRYRETSGRERVGHWPKDMAKYFALEGWDATDPKEGRTRE